MKRGHGILIDPLYDGRMVWNRVQLLAGLIGGEAFPEGCATGRTEAGLEPAEFTQMA